MVHEKLTESKQAGKWWDGKKKKEGQTWTTLVHNGPQFPPDYEPLPETVKVLYDGKEIDLDSVSTKNKFHITAEEAAVFYAAKLYMDERLSVDNPNRQKIVNPTFIKNFWTDWKTILGSKHIIKNLGKVDFTPIINHLIKTSEEKKAANKEKTKEEKKEEKEEKERNREIYGYAILDGVKIPVAGYVIQPPGLFTGHAGAPRTGKIKARVLPEDVTINASKAPKCLIHGKPCKWGQVVTNKDVVWLASYKNPVTDRMAYINLDRKGSHLTKSKDIEKFEKARKLSNNIEKIRKVYMQDLNSTDSHTKQLATAVYLLDKLAIRPGTEKDETKEAGTLGLTTLKCNNIKFGTDDNITISFLGKSSIEFDKTFKVDKKVYTNLSGLCKGNSKSEIFPNVNATSLNAYLKNLLPDLTAKVFRTYKASSILQEQLSENIPDIDTPTQEKKLSYDQVNIEVALALNHKKLTGSNKRIENLKNKIKEYKEKKKEATTDAKKAAINKSIKANELKLKEAELNISTGTSKLNYLDPRITVAWCKKGEVPIEKIYNKTQLVKFDWAMESPPDWVF